MSAWGYLGRFLYHFAVPVIAPMIDGSRRARVLVLRQDGGVTYALLTRNWLSKQEWSLPGGGLHRGEQPAVAAARELGEELGIKVDPAGLVPLVEKTIAKPRYTYQVIAFGLWVQEEKFNRHNLELLDARWFDVRELPTPCSRIVGESLAAWQAKGTGVYS